jgi:hypothetical protein
VSALGGHSLLVRNPHFRSEDEDGDMCHAIFATDTIGFSPEFFARTGGELYLAGLNSTTLALPEEASQVVPSEAAISQLKACAKAMVVNVPGRELEVLREGLVRLLKLLLASNANTTTVLPTSDVQRPPHRFANTRRDVGRHQDSGRCAGRSVCCGWAWGLGDHACAWDGACAGGDASGTDTECED